jgi:hypothetical protein
MPAPPIHLYKEAPWEEEMTQQIEGSSFEEISCPLLSSPCTSPLSHVSLSFGSLNGV